MQVNDTPAFPRFVPTEKSQFFGILQKRVNQYFKEKGISRHATPEMIVKTVILLSSWVIPVLLLNFLHLTTASVIALYLILAFAQAGIGMSVMHDANHGAYSNKMWVNRWLGNSLNLIGGMSFNWKIQHNVLHHTYTNIHGVDDDITDKLIVRLDPHTEPKKIYRFQGVYIFFIYSIMTLYWAVAKDYVQFFKYRKQGLHRFKASKGRSLFVSMTLLKLAFFAYMIILPIVIQGYSVGLIVGGFLLMCAVSGSVLAFVFQLAHSVEEADFPLPTDKNEIQNEWAIHQLNTTVNFARENRLLSWYVGGLNYQVEHHLFPNICHVHYPAISQIVEETAKEFNVPYLCAPSLGHAFRSHMATIRKLGYVPELDLASM
jgi:linoleoyl-CoA desaturase